MRTCKICKIEKCYNYLTINSQGRYVYKDEGGNIWHGRTCGSCWAEIVCLKAIRPHLKPFKCINCGQEVRQRHAKQLSCSRSCYQKHRYKQLGAAN